MRKFMCYSVKGEIDHKRRIVMEIVKKLLTVKSIVTIVLTIVFAYLSIVGKIDGGQFLTIFTVIISFYFGTQTVKENKG